MVVECIQLAEFDVLIGAVEADTVVHYQLLVQGRPISFRAFLNGLHSNAMFRQCFNKLLADAPFKSYRFETPALSSCSLDSTFEFVLLDSPGLSKRPVDVYSFAEYFNDANAECGEGIVEFRSLGGDATLIAPVPLSEHETYNHLASFVRKAPESQIDALWQFTGQVVMRDVGAAPLWLNTEGSGVAWLHVRIDSRPKYYGYADYKVVNSGKKPGALI